MKHLLFTVLFSLFPLFSFSAGAGLKQGVISRIAGGCLHSFRKAVAQKKPLNLLEELSGSDVQLITTIADVRLGSLWGAIDFVPPESYGRRSIDNRRAEYSFSSVAPTKKEKGRVFLLFQIGSFFHWIHWRSDVAEPHLSEDAVKAVFNSLYEKAYGLSADGMAERGIFSGVHSFLTENHRQGNYGIDLQDTLQIRERLAGDNEGLKQILVQGLKSPGRSAKLHTDGEILSLVRESRMPSLIHEIAMASFTPEELKSFSWISQLTPKELEDLYNSADKIQTLNMRLIAPTTAVRLLSGNRLWRGAVTRDQIRQLDVRAPGIQYIFSPTFKHFTWEAPSETLSVDTLTDEQIEAMDRDTFLRDVFLAGDVYTEAYLPRRAVWFRLHSKMRVKELGYDAVMSDSLPRPVYAFIARKLGFSEDFENMTSGQKRELFKKEIALMTDARRQSGILNDEDFEALMRAHYPKSY